VRFAFIRDHKAVFPVEVLCKVLKVSRGGYYVWSRRPPSPAAVRRGGLVTAIQQAHIESRATVTVRSSASFPNLLLSDDWDGIDPFTETRSWRHLIAGHWNGRD
jgi:hypothetical protein